MLDISRLNINKEWLQAAVLFLFLFPIFYQLSGSIFTDQGSFNSRGKLLLVPLPFASIFCFVGIVFLLRLEKRYFGMGFIFSMFIAMMLSVIISKGAEADFELSRFVLLIQFLLPLFALVLGGLYVPPKSDHLKFEAIMLYVLLLVLPLQVVATLIDGNVHLAAHLFLFTLYQHLQYLPVIFVSFFLIGAFTFYDNKRMRILVLFLAMWMGAYLSTSLSMSAIMLMVIGSVALTVSLYKKNRARFALLLIGLALASFTIHFSATDQTRYYSLKLGEDLRISQNKQEIFDRLENEYLSKYQNTIIASLPSNLKERVLYWLVFGEGALESQKSLLVGHTNRLDRDIFPSAHNYYLDLVYNFGLVSLLPFLYLITVTFRDSWRATVRKRVDPNLLILILLVGFFLVVDSSLKVGFRQPYPGMMMSFIWGVLLTRLWNLNNEPGVTEASPGAELSPESRQKIS